ncbi:putative membrane protein YczE [Breznakia sp. PF5-3]|uniref:YczE/YyaS/YitT family protein n=1 Tax=unclassified Breznakia TaxID=2623764 RepID=UPI0024067162|nr:MULTISPECIES: YitT family protein [unclassified Breznakia]MDF9824958.1 putative membrane protein YczE [Breznakia sp. PM6-1]MDF9835774.1 putative membrane protein YczE [Breznakia sp. PF5-3]MDF9837932.1 putative membrane protein YczE [Breznakia sp. PFB2-8]MDF9859921.1 putative membrane protein YczE [Breznakia sp. PH5-24]
MNISFLKKVLFLSMGAIILGIGIGLAIVSGHGGDAISVFSEGLSETFKVTIGTASIGFYILFMIPMLVIDRKQFGIGTIVSPFICAITLDLFLTYVSFEMTTIETVLCMAIGIVLIGIGIGIYVSVELGRSSYDAIILAISKKLGKPLWIIKSSGDLILCIFGYMLGGTLGLGPVCAVIFIGPILEMTLKFIDSK